MRPDPHPSTPARVPPPLRRLAGTAFPPKRWTLSPSGRAPLALYLFTCDKALQERVMIQTHAGSMAINEAVLQMRFMYPPYGRGQPPNGC
jgi:hypothetical protein